MTVVSVGAYLEALRDAQKLKPKEVVDLIGQLGIETTPTYIWRIEHGKIATPGAPLLAAFTRVVHGNINQVMDLLLNKEATAEDGRHFAQIWLQQKSIQQQSTQLPTAFIDEIQPHQWYDTEFAQFVEEIKTVLAEDRSMQSLFIGALRAFIAGWRVRGHQSAADDDR